MNDWRCPADGTALEPTPAGLRCGSCGADYPLSHGVVDFGGPPRETPPVIVELLRRVREGSAERAADVFCREHGCQRVRNGPAWKLLLPVDSASHVLEVGSGFGDVTVDLASRSGQVTALAADAQAGQLVRALADERGVTNLHIASIGALDRLPFDDATFDAVVGVEAGLDGFGITQSALPRFAAELGRVAAPGATVLIGRSNALHRFPGVGMLRAVVTRSPVRTLDRVVHDALERAGTTVGGAIPSALQAAGFAAPRLFAPIPDEEHAKAILPVADKAVVRYFLANLVRRNAPLTRAVLALLDPLVGLGLFPRIVPYAYHVFEVPEDS